VTTDLTPVKSVSVLDAVVSGQLLHRLQSVQNAAARLVTGTRRQDMHNTSSVQFKLATGLTTDHVQDSSHHLKVSS